MIQNKTMADLIHEHEAAMTQYKEVKQAEEVARTRMNSAINRLNAAQKAIDELTEALRKQAPLDTDWHSRRNSGHPVTD